MDSRPGGPKALRQAPGPSLPDFTPRVASEAMVVDRSNQPKALLPEVASVRSADFGVTSIQATPASTAR